MSSDETGASPDPRDRREAVRVKAQQVKARQARNRVLRRAAIVLAILVVVGGGALYSWFAVFQPALSKPTLQPANFTADDGVVVDDTIQRALAAEDPQATTAPAETDPAEDPAEEPISIHVYVDYLSEAAGEFQRVNADQLEEWRSQGAVRVVYHPVAMLTSKSNGTKYSQRAAGAVACVVDHAPEAFEKFNHELLTNQPAPDSDGFSDAELADRAIATGARDTKTVRSCIENEDFVAWAREATERALNEPLPGTKNTLDGVPTILVDGQPYVGALDVPEEFAAFLLAIDSESYLESATPTPEPEEAPAD